MDALLRAGRGGRLTGGVDLTKTVVMSLTGDFHEFQKVRVLTGRISQWDDAKGYGWAEADGLRVFVHVKEFVPGQRRPRNGEEIRFTLESDAQGRPRAGKGELVNPGGRIGPVAWCVWAVLLVLPGTALLFLPWPPWWVSGVAVVVSAVAWKLYAVDKQRAGEGAWRIPETRLHLCELLGGWPGAFLAQRRFRHKCRKPSYQVMFWLIVLLHQYVAADVILDHSLSRLAWKTLMDKVERRS